MCTLDRWEVLAAYNMYAVLWAGGPYADSVSVRLHALRYSPALPDQSLETLSPEAKAIYGQLELKHHQKHVAYQRWRRRRPDLFPPWPGSQYFKRTETCYQDWVISLGIDPACLTLWEA